MRNSLLQKSPHPLPLAQTIVKHVNVSYHTHDRTNGGRYIIQKFPKIPCRPKLVCFRCNVSTLTEHRAVWHANITNKDTKTRWRMTTRCAEQYLACAFKCYLSTCTFENPKARLPTREQLQKAGILFILVIFPM